MNKIRLALAGLVALAAAFMLTAPAQTRRLTYNISGRTASQAELCPQ
jgi:hypothetical protein